ncbi:hypothetical protein E5720_06935 [Rhodococcus sp. PAMC28707]|uniref:hypothetical protein n=1 Tax=unclassified Rhodococcus (in: high G+C Gram-positive bacteria) TaxID=192944 RepID=UPI00109D8E9C|nr:MULTISPECIES: hypothetical protein [unclassified Rhodococcus (in: high G+C Gram-positive bacteria)]QCB50022.1 hypothetical protein E5769_07080 [Rhodococcus sp. PAMC28705]QCB58283.1 hypothetical protein E5720_06935 [Rhodococcus sp. PAMC28707]
MSLSTTLEPTGDGRRASDVRDLLVLWRHPVTRWIQPIGRLSQGLDHYSFSYTRAAAEIPELRTLPGLPDLWRRYDSQSLPAVFGQRVMERSRSNYDTYMTWLGLDPRMATPWEQIVYSGGRRAGDTLQFMEVPCVVDGRVHARFLVNGIRHVAGQPCTFVNRVTRVSPREHEAAFARLHVGAIVTIEAEIENESDENASMVTAGGVPLGWVPRSLSQGVRKLLAYGPISPTVIAVRGIDTPSHLRLVLDLDVEVPDGFSFDPAGNWQPLA